MRQLVVPILIASVISGCVQQRSQVSQTYTSPYPAQATTKPLRDWVEVKDDQFEKLITFNGLEARHGEDSYGIAINVFMIRSWLGKATMKSTHQIYLTDYYDGSGWKFWSRASDENATTLEVRDISRDVGSCSRYGGCSHFETIGISVDDATLRTKQASGYKIKISSKSGNSKIIFVTPEQISAQIREIDARVTVQAPEKMQGVKKKKK